MPPGVELRPRPLEVACGLAIGRQPGVPPLDVGGRAGTSLRGALDEALRVALEHPPCLVAFSGGRDSSLLLALAVDLARREQLPLPIAVSYRFAGAPGSEESSWQESVIGHVGAIEWDRVFVGDELDAVGRAFRRMVDRTGLLWPFNAHFTVPLLERATGGSLVTGTGGDELFGPSRWWRVHELVRARRPPRTRSDARIVANGIARPLRRGEPPGWQPLVQPWLRPGAVDAVDTARWRFAAEEPVGRRRAVAGWWWPSRTRWLLSTGAAARGAAFGVRVTMPFLEAEVLAAAARWFGFAGRGTRRGAVAALAGDLLPEDVVARRTKAFFDEAFFGAASRTFAAAWTGDGVDHQLVDAEALAETWSAAHPDPRSFSLLQSAWLATLPEDT